MTIENYGVSLCQLQKSDLETVRTWRNNDQVRKKMVYQEIISEQSQDAWFKSLDSTKDLYFILKQDSPVGLINLKDINWKSLTAESGIFLGNTSYFNSTVPVIASILLSEFAFYGLGLKRLYSTTLASNKSALDLDNQLGFIQVNKLGNGAIRNECTVESFEMRATKLRYSFHRKYGAEMTITAQLAEPVVKSLLKNNPDSSIDQLHGELTIKIVAP